MAPIDPRHVRVCQFVAPTPDEKRHHFLWRFWRELPGWGGMAIFDRTWYGRVLVERVEGYATREQWMRAYEEINNFERSLADEGTILIKIWMHISADEQLKRFKRREKDPLKSWKLTDEDWRNREKRDVYEEAIEDMLARNDQPNAPWSLIAGESKRYARVKVIETVCERIEEGMREWGMEPPPPLDDADDRRARRRASRQSRARRRRPCLLPAPRPGSRPRRGPAGPPRPPRRCGSGSPPRRGSRRSCRRRRRPSARA